MQRTSSITGKPVFTLSPRFHWLEQFEKRDFAAEFAAWAKRREEASDVE